MYSFLLNPSAYPHVQFPIESLQPIFMYSSWQDRPVESSLCGATTWPQVRIYGFAWPSSSVVSLGLQGSTPIFVSLGKQYSTLQVLPSIKRQNQWNSHNKANMTQNILEYSCSAHLNKLSLKGPNLIWFHSGFPGDAWQCWWRTTDVKLTQEASSQQSSEMILFLDRHVLVNSVDQIRLFLTVSKYFWNRETQTFDNVMHGNSTVNYNYHTGS